MNEEALEVWDWGSPSPVGCSPWSHPGSLATALAPLAKDSMGASRGEDL